MKIQGQAVSHHTFGCGMITSLTDTIVTVRFPAGEKKFRYPEAFEEHLVLQNKRVQQTIADQIAKKQMEIDRRHERMQAEQARLQKLRNYKISVNSHAVFHVAPACLEQVCQTCAVSTGRYLTGCSKGQPRVAERLKPNSACLLTTLPAGKPEQFRQVVGAFMVKEDFFGEDSNTGIIEGHPDHRMFVPAGEQLLFWEHFDSKAAARWGNTAFKYCACAAMDRILSEMVQMSEHTKAYSACVECYRYFCHVNRIRPSLTFEPEQL